ncbi:MAG TPA: TIGR00725 family protein [Crinalium sp.]|jgi:hypothetical protein
MRKRVIGVMGPGAGAAEADCQVAYVLGKLIAQQQWVLLTGGRNVGVMDAANRGAKAANGLTVGILPGDDDAGLSDTVDIAIATGLGNARNAVNVLSCDAVVVCGMGAGTASEAAFAIKMGKPLILLNATPASRAFFLELAGDRAWIAETPEAAIQLIQSYLSR